MRSTSSSPSRSKTDPLRIAAWALLAATALSGPLHLAGYTLLSALPKTILCPFRALTGLPCPGCGMTHAFLALGRLDFAGAYSFNPLVFPLAALTVLFVAGRVPRSVRSGITVNLALLGVLAFWGGRLLQRIY
ncbi:MAG: DUF2752 domain-containing protein [Elusimicrobiota bacterium]|nr:DUF2752 domain-containing protein [Elusimicrobiota bacterium]